jgi:hypothetical protein
MELTWAGYRISVRVQRNQDERTPCFGAERMYQPRSRRERREAEKQCLLASGCRYVDFTK